MSPAPTRVAGDQAPSAAPDDLRARLAALPGVDAVAGLKTLRDRAERYAELLLDLAAGSAREIPALRACLAHSIKGAAGTLSAHRLQACAAELDAALRAGRPDAELAILMDALEAPQVEFAAAVQTLR